MAHPGAVIVVFLLGLLVSGTVGWIGSFRVALVGACLLVGLLRAITWNRARAF